MPFVEEATAALHGQLAPQKRSMLAGIARDHAAGVSGPERDPGEISLVVVCQRLSRRLRRQRAVAAARKLHAI